MSAAPASGGAPKRLVLYDLDGTLVDTLDDITEAANHMLRALGRPPRPREQVRGLIGLGLHQLVQGCLETKAPAQVARGSALYRAYYTEHLLDHSRLYPGAREVLEHFKARTQAVVSNKPNPYSRRIVEALDTAQYFLDVIGGNSGFPKKPDPAALRALMERAGSAPGETLFIGDSPVDVATGRQAGVMTVAVTHGFSNRAELEAAGPDVLLGDFAGLLDAARRHGW